MQCVRLTSALIYLSMYLSSKSYQQSEPFTILQKLILKISFPELFGNINRNALGDDMLNSLTFWYRGMAFFLHFWYLGELELDWTPEWYLTHSFAKVNFFSILLVTASIDLLNISSQFYFYQKWCESLTES